MDDVRNLYEKILIFKKRRRSKAEREGFISRHYYSISFICLCVRISESACHHLVISGPDLHPEHWRCRGPSQPPWGHWEPTAALASPQPCQVWPQHQAHCQSYHQPYLPAFAKVKDTEKKVTYPNSRHSWVEEFTWHIEGMCLRYKIRLTRSPTRNGSVTNVVFLIILEVLKNMLFFFPSFVSRIFQCR